MCLSAAMWASIHHVVYACSRDKLSEAYYGGSYDISVINQTFTHPMELTHASEFEDESLAVVKEWEISLP